MNEKIKAVLEAFEKNNIDAVFAADRQEAKKIALSLVNEGDTVASGGSVTLKECGIIDEIQKLDREGKVNYLDRNKASSPEEYEEIMRRAFLCDIYFTSSNALLSDGKLFNVDGNGNRVAALTYGPKTVAVVVGTNKITDTLDEALYRLRTIAAPANCVRLNKETYCAKTGHCIALDTDADGCDSPDRICRSYLLTSRQREKGRIKVILVDEKLGY